MIFVTCSRITSGMSCSASASSHTGRYRSAISLPARSMMVCMLWTRARCSVSRSLRFVATMVSEMTCTSLGPSFDPILLGSSENSINYRLHQGSETYHVLYYQSQEKLAEQPSDIPRVSLKCGHQEHEQKLSKVCPVSEVMPHRCTDAVDPGERSCHQSQQEPEHVDDDPEKHRTGVRMLPGVTCCDLSLQPLLQCRDLIPDPAAKPRYPV